MLSKCEEGAFNGTTFFALLKKLCQTSCHASGRRRANGVDQFHWNVSLGQLEFADLLKRGLEPANT
jgi:hypothetical protein